MLPFSSMVWKQFGRVNGSKVRPALIDRIDRGLPGCLLFFVDCAGALHESPAFLVRTLLCFDYLYLGNAVMCL